MAVQVLNDMPDAAVHRGEPVRSRAPASLNDAACSDDAVTDAAVKEPAAVDASLSEWSPRTARAESKSNRPLFVAITIGVHVAVVLGFLSMRHVQSSAAPPPPLVAEIIEAPRSPNDAPPMTPPPLQQVSYSLPAPEVIAIEVESITPPPVATAIAPSASQSVAPPMVESVEYVRAPSPVYPRESSRRHERGTVLLRVLVDASGRPAQIQIERSSGFERLDIAARQAVEKAMFRPYEVNGVPQAAQVLIPIEFTRRAG